MITIYQNFNPKSQRFDRPINAILARIKNGKSKALIDRIRITGNKELKTELPCILFSGQFNYRNSKSLVKHSGFICLDFDGFPDSETLLTWKDTLESDEYTYSVFLSPSGYGLKCLIKIPAEPENHKSYFDALKEYYDSKYFDSHCSDICRICFESYDPYLTINESSKLWGKKKSYIPKPANQTSHNLNESKTAENLLKWWNKKYGNTPGNRNANLFKLCAAFNDYGVTDNYAISIVSNFQQEDFQIQEIERIVKNAYRKTEKFGTLKF